MFKHLIKNILRKEKVTGIINLVLVGDQEIQRLNKEFRGKDKPTDVLAFPMGEDGIVGDIAISTETAKRNALLFGVGYKAEMTRLVVHGALHLCGYRHGPRMRDAEKTYQKL
ncbi:rRNA maturation RNase YbeY [Candidatus Saganbacteria bacterium CG08_land_8_20_14_0_20_45_16]|uniref:Endoribonuclease YbeY n=1 Tax=Candidatus Saganbacteria bacterium CG08_land_8_20_14_0_20_45_16 TaxID=2014293 RepID=A0A2H0XYS6_UNCSA|nr:MAG: rRNA maturation RNase YbeY [Candidatus Saganbacteria bacterium CG08_land_8_20_14_0_20_45_16]